MLVRSIFDGWRCDEDRFDWSVQSYFWVGSTDCVHAYIAHIFSVESTHLPWASHVSRKSARHKHWDVCCNKIPTSSFTIWRMLLHSHSTAFHRSCQVSCLQVSWPCASSHSVHKLLATSLCVVDLDQKITSETSMCPPGPNSSKQIGTDVARRLNHELG